MIAKHHQYEKVVIGGTLGALLYSYNNSAPIVINNVAKPHRFEYNSKGESRQELWNKLYFLLSLAGLNLFGDKAAAIRIDKSHLSITTNRMKQFHLAAEKFYIFDDENVKGLPEPIGSVSDKQVVLDWMIARPCMEHDLAHIKTEDDFVKDVYFYPTERIFGNHQNKKDLVAVSYLSEEQLQSFEYSDTFARFKTEKLLKENGIRGSRSGFSDGKQVYNRLKLEVKKREVRKLCMREYKNTKNACFMYSDCDTIKVPVGYQQKVNSILKVV